MKTGLFLLFYQYLNNVLTFVQSAKGKQHSLPDGLRSR